MYLLANIFGLIFKILQHKGDAQVKTDAWTPGVQGTCACQNNSIQKTIARPSTSLTSVSPENCFPGDIDVTQPSMTSCSYARVAFKPFNMYIAP